MMRVKSNSSFGLNSKSVKTEAINEKKEEEWEVRPGGMLVQKRSPDSESAVKTAAAPIPTIRVKVKYDSVYYEIYLSSQSTFGELKKLLAERTGLHHLDQKIMYKDKERDSSAFLDICGVKDKSKLVMMVDPVAHAKRLLEVQKAAKLEKATKNIKEISGEVDKLALQVSVLDKLISSSKKVAEKEISNLIERLMMQLVKLDGITAHGDLQLQRGMQVGRVQKLVETLDILKIKNEKITTPVSLQQQNSKNEKREQLQKQESKIVVTTEWEMFDSLPAPTTSTKSTSTTASNSTASSANNLRAEWELF